MISSVADKFKTQKYVAIHSGLLQNFPMQEITKIFKAFKPQVLLFKIIFSTPKFVSILRHYSLSLKSQSHDDTDIRKSSNQTHLTHLKTKFLSPIYKAKSLLYKTERVRKISKPLNFNEKFAPHLIPPPTHFVRGGRIGEENFLTSSFKTFNLHFSLSKPKTLISNLNHFFQTPRLHFSPKLKIIILTSLILLILSPLHSTIIHLHFHDQWNLVVAGLVVQAQGNGVTQTDTTDQYGSATFSIPYVSVGEHPSSPFPALLGSSIIRGKATFTLSIPAHSSFPISVFDATGRKIIHHILSLEPGTYTITLSLSHTGVFFLSTPYSTLKLINLQPAGDHISIRLQGTSSPQTISSN